MSLLIIDARKCKQDGFCARECPTAIIRLKEKETCMRPPAATPG